MNDLIAILLGVTLTTTGLYLWYKRNKWLDLVTRKMWYTFKKKCTREDCRTNMLTTKYCPVCGRRKKKRRY